MDVEIVAKYLCSASYPYHWVLVRETSLQTIYNTYLSTITIKAPMEAIALG